MANQSLEEILSRLNVLGATSTGGSSAYANYLAVLNSSGQLNSSLFSSTINVHTLTALSDLSGLTGQTGDLAVLPYSSAYVYITGSTQGYSSGPWVQIGVVGSGAQAFAPTSGNPVTATNVQDAINQLAALAVLKSSSSGPVNTTVTFDVTDNFGVGQSPFAIGTDSAGLLVTGLNAQMVGGRTIADIFNLSNPNSYFTGPIAAALLSGTYNIDISGQSAHAQSAAGVDIGVVVPNATHAVTADSATIAFGLDSSVHVDAYTLGTYPASYFTDIANLTDGGAGHVLAGSLFSDASHGLRGSGTTGSPAHALVTTASGGAPGFMSAADKSKLDSIPTNAEHNQNAYNTVTATTGSTVAATETDSFAIVGDSSGVINTSATTGQVTINVNTTAINTLIAAYLSGSGSPLTNYVNATGSGKTISAQHTFNSTSSGVSPFLIGSNSYNVLVSGLNASQLGGQPGSYYTNFANQTLASGVSLPSWLSDAIATDVAAAFAGLSSLSTGSLTTTSGVSVGTTLDVTGLATFSGGVTIPGLSLASNSGTTYPSLVGVSSAGRLQLMTYTLDSGTLYSGLSTQLINGTPATNGSYISWTKVGSPTYTIKPVLNLFADDITTTGTTKFVTPTNLATNFEALITSGSALITSLQSNSAWKASFATYNTDGSINLGVVNTSGNVITTGNIIATKFFNNGDATVPGNELVNKSALASITGQATSDLPLLPFTTISAVTTAVGAGTLVVNPGDIVLQSGTYYIYTNPAVYSTAYNSANWIALVAPTTAPDAFTGSSGFITANKFGELLRTCYLTESKASAPIFLPEFRVAEPAPLNNTTNYTNAQWKQYSANAIQTRGQAGQNYLTVLRVRGYIKPQHKAQLSYQYYNSSQVLTNGTIVLNSAATNSIPPATNPQTYQYIDIAVAPLLAGQSTVLVSITQYDGIVGGLQPTAVFPGIPPYSNGTAQTFNGEFVYINAEGVAAASTNRPYAPYSPDLLPLQYEGEVISGGASNYDIFPPTTYDGEPVYDSQDVVNNYTTSTISGTDYASGSTDPHYIVATSGQTIYKYEKPRIRTNHALNNKMFGFNGFLRPNSLVMSPSGFTLPLSNSTDPSATVQASTLNQIINGNLALSGDCNIGDVIDFGTIGSGGGAIALNFTVNSSYQFIGPGSSTTVRGTTLGQLFAYINTLSPGEVTIGYNSTLDRITVTRVIVTVAPAAPIGSFTGQVHYTSGLFNILRLSFNKVTTVSLDGITTTDTWTGVSLPVASGLRTSTVLPSLSLKNPVGFISNNGSYIIDGNLVTYTSSDTITSLNTSSNKLNALNYNLDYVAEANKLRLYKTTGPDYQCILPPRVFDVTGTLMTSFGLEKYSFGNKDLPIESVHSIRYQTDGIWVGGNFRNYNGATSHGLVKLDLSGKIAPSFNIGLGFDNAIRTIAPIVGSTDVLVGGTTPTGLNGKNKKAIWRLTNSGSENTATNVTDIDLSSDDHSRLLDILPMADGNLVVLTPLQIQIRNSSGTLLSTYYGTKSFHNMVKYLDLTDGSGGTSFMLTSQAFTSAGVSQTITPPSGVSFAEPLGLRMMVYYPATPPTVTLSGGGATTQAQLQVIMNGSGVLTAVNVISPGSGYTQTSGTIAPGATNYPTVTVVGGVGSGFAITSLTFTGGTITAASFTATSSPLSPTIVEDAIWAQSGGSIAGAGTGANASCAYAVVGAGQSNTPNAPYVVCGNSGTYWNSSITTPPGDVGWNQRGAGNLLIESGTLALPSGSSIGSYPGTGTPWTVWPWALGGGVGAGTAVFTNTGTSAPNYTTVTNTSGSSSEIAYIYQVVDISSYQLYSGVTSANPGNVGYRFIVDIATTSSAGGNPYVGLIFTNSTDPTAATNRSVGSIVDIQAGNLAVGSPNIYDPYSGALIGSIGIAQISGTSYCRVTITCQDTNTGSHYVLPVVYPAYSNALTGAATGITGNIQIIDASLMYSEWSNTYVSTSTTQIRPSASSSQPFKGLYKIGLEDRTITLPAEVGGGSGTVKRGWAWPQFACTILMSEPQSHPIVFGVDDSDRIYLGGPISSINGNTVTPWGLYRVDAYGFYDSTFVPVFDDMVTSCVVTPYDQLIVGGKFTSYNKRSVGKLVFMDLYGNVITSVGASNDNVIISATAPTDTSKLWLDTAFNPPQLNLYDVALTSWVNIVNLARTLPTPSITPLYSDPTDTTNVTDLAITLSGAFNIKANQGLCSALNDVYVILTINGTNIAGYVPGTSLASYIQNAGTYTVTACIAGSSSNTTWSPSYVASYTFVIQSATPAPTISNTVSPFLFTGQPSYTGIQISSPWLTGGGGFTGSSQTLYYYTYLVGQVVPNPIPWTTANSVGAASVSVTLSTISSNTVVIAKAKVNNLKMSTVATKEVDVLISGPGIAYNPTGTYGGGSQPQIQISLPGGWATTTNYGILYTVGPTLGGGPVSPTIANYTGTPGSVLLAPAATLPYWNILTNVLDNQYDINGNLTVLASLAYLDPTTGIPTSQSAVTSVTFTRLTQPGYLVADTSLLGTAISSGTLYVPTASSSSNVYTNVAVSAFSLQTVQGWYGSGAEVVGSLITATHTGTTNQYFPSQATATIVNSRTWPGGSATATTLPSAVSTITLQLTPNPVTVNTIANGSGFITGFWIQPQTPTTSGDQVWYQILNPTTSSTVTNPFLSPSTGGRATSSTTPTTGTLYGIVLVQTDGTAISDGTVGSLQHFHVTTGGHTYYYTAPIIPLENYPAAGGVYVCATEFIVGGATALDTMLTYTVPQYTTFPTLGGKYQLVDEVTTDMLAGVNRLLTESSTTNLLTYDTSGNVLAVPNDSSTPSSKIVYNNTATITSATTADNSPTPAASGALTMFNPPANAISNLQGAAQLSISLRFFKSGYLASRQITINTKLALPVPTITIDTVAGTGSSSGSAPEYMVVMSSTMPTAEIYYTLDGSVPNQNNNLYTGPFYIKANVASIQAVAFKTNWVTSSVATVAPLNTSPSFSDSFTSTSQLVNIACGAPIDETVLVNKPTQLVYSLSTSSGAFVIGSSSTPTSITNMTNAPIGDGLVGIDYASIEGQSAYTAQGYWNIISSLDNQKWVGLRDALGSWNSNGILATRSYFGTTQAPNPYPNLAVSSLANTGLTSGDNVMLEVEGLSQGKYLLIAYGQKTQFDLDLEGVNNVCLSKNSVNPAFYNYGSPLFDQSALTSLLTFSNPVIPVYAFKVIGVSCTAGSLGNQVQWVVDTTATTNCYVPKTWYNNLVANSSALSNQIFRDGTNTTIASNGIVYVPTSAVDGYPGFLGQPGSISNVVSASVNNVGNNEIYGATNATTNYINTTFTTVYNQPIYGWASTPTIPDFSYQVITITNLNGDTAVLKLGALTAQSHASNVYRCPQLDTTVAYGGSTNLFTGQLYTALGTLTLSIADTSNNPCIAYAVTTNYLIPNAFVPGSAGPDGYWFGPLTTATPNQPSIPGPYTTPFTPTNTTYSITGYASVSAVPSYSLTAPCSKDYSTTPPTTLSPPITSTITRSSLSATDNVTFSTGWDFIAIALPSSSGGLFIGSGALLDLTKNYTTSAGTSSIQLNRMYYAPDVNVTGISPVPDIGPQASAITYSPATLDPTANGIVSMLLGNFNSNITSVEWAYAAVQDSFGLQLTKINSYALNTAGLSCNESVGVFVTPISIQLLPTVVSGIGNYSYGTHSVPLYCAGVTNGATDPTSLTSSSVSFQVLGDTTTNVSVTWWCATTLDSSGAPISAVPLSSGANYNITTSRILNVTTSVLTFITMPITTTNYYYAIATGGGTTLNSLNSTGGLIGVTNYIPIENLAVTATDGTTTYTSGMINIIAGVSKTFTFTAYSPSIPSVYAWFWDTLPGFVFSSPANDSSGHQILGNTLHVVCAPGASGSAANTFYIDTTYPLNRAFAVKASSMGVPSTSGSGLTQFCDEAASQHTDATVMGVNVTNSFTCSISINGPLVGTPLSGCLLTNYYSYPYGPYYASLQVSATPAGSDTLTYQWYQDGTAMSGQTSAALVFTSPVTTAHTYNCIVTDTGTTGPGSWNSSSAEVIHIAVYNQVNVTELLTSPAALPSTGVIILSSTGATVDHTLSYSVQLNVVTPETTAPDTGHYYQWYKSTDNGTTWSYISGATSVGYNITGGGGSLATGVYKFAAKVSSINSILSSPTCDIVDMTTSGAAITITVV